MEPKKSYNPFKMWGSWAGLIIGVLSFFDYQFWHSARSTYWHYATSINPFDWLPPGAFAEGYALYFLLILTTPIFLFLYGWGIHSLFRKFSSK